MGQYELLEIFFEYPTRSFGLRELERLTKIPKTTLSRNLALFLKEKIIIKDKSSLDYVANEDEKKYRIKKKMYAFEKIQLSGLINHIKEEIHPKCIILFGSFSKGEFNSKSDIDLFVQTKEQKISLVHFEKKLKHKINLFFEEDLNNLSVELFNNIINGTKLDGYLKLKK